MTIKPFVSDAETFRNQANLSERSFNEWAIEALRYCVSIDFRAKKREVSEWSYIDPQEIERRTLRVADEPVVPGKPEGTQRKKTGSS